MQRVTLIDNYDSFTFNLVHYLGELGADVCGVAQRRDQRRRDARGRRPTPSSSRPAPARRTRRASVSISCAPRARRRRSSASASAIRRSARRSAARSCARPRRCTARSRASRIMRAACFAASTARSRRRAIIRWSSSARPPRRNSKSAPRADDGLIMAVAHQRAPGLRRAVPSGEHRERAWPPHPEQFP